MRFKYSLAFPIILIISLVAAVTLFIGYHLNLSSLRDAIEARETDRSKAIYRAVREKISDDINELKVYSQFLKKDTQLLDALIYHQVLDDREPLNQTINYLYLPLAATEVNFFIVTDQDGHIITQAVNHEAGGDLSGVWGMEEALAGKDTLSAGYGPLGWSILSLVPLSYAGKQYGVLVMGISLNNDFAKKIAEATQTQISFCTAYQIIASSWPAAKQSQVDLAQVTDTIMSKKSTFFNNSPKNFNSFYIPIKIVDDTICLVINADTSAINHLLQSKQNQLFFSLLAVLLATVGVGSFLALNIVRPLKKLQARSLAAVRVFSQKDLTLSPWGNEIETLSQALESMLAAIMTHLRELHQAQETIKKEKLFLDNVFSSIQDGLRVLDLDFTIIRANPVLEQRYGQSPIVGQKCYQLIHGFNEPCTDCPCQKAIATGKASYQSKPVLIGDNEEWIDIYAYPLRDQDTGEITGIIEYSRNITEIKATEEALRQREEQLRQASKMEAVGRLAGGVAHDFNNILTVILGECELLLMQLPAQDPLREKVTGVIDAARRAASLTQQLLAFSRKQVLQPQLLDLNVVVANMDRMLQRVLGEDIDLVTILSPDLGTVKVDLHQMEQVILNLAANARDAMPRGGSLTVETANVDLDESYTQQHAETQPGPYVMLAISDTGVGLDPEAQSRIFEPFFTTKEVGQGTGLGLSMVYGIVKQSQGHIAVYSEPGQGTTLKIYLPRVDQPALSSPEPPGVRGVPSRGTETILLLEDEEGVRQVVSHMLTQSGYQVLAAAHPVEALRLSQEYQGPIHLLFTDVVLPGMSGLECAKLIQAQHPHLQVIFMSGYTENAVVHHGVLDSGLTFIHKPFKFDILLQKIRQVLDTASFSPSEASPS
ncbi:MAG: ATP-binding protein [Thermodesulfobacteriota bacterium]